MLEKTNGPDTSDFIVFMDRLKLNDSETWRRFDFTIKRILLKWLNKKGIEWNQALEVYNDTMAVFLEKYKLLDFDNYARLKSYIFSIADNKTKELWRMNSKARRNTEIENAEPLLYADVLSLEEEHLAKDSADKVFKFFNILTTKEKQVLTSIYRDELDPEEVARKMNISYSNLRVIKYRALNKIRNKLKNKV